MHNIIISAVLILAMSIHAAEQRSWTSKKGDKVQAVFIKESSGIVLLKKADNKTIKIKRSFLSDLDNSYIDTILNPPKENIIYLKPSISIYGWYEAFNPKTKKTNNSRELKSLIVKSSKINSCDSITFKLVNSLVITEDCTWKIIRVTELPKTLISTKYTDTSVKTPGRFIKIYFSIKNNTNLEGFANIPEIKDSKDRTYNLITESRYYLNKDEIDIHLLKVKPGFPVNAAGIYEIPSDSKDLKVRLPTFSSYKYDTIYLPVYWEEIPMPPMVNNNLKK